MKWYIHFDNLTEESCFMRIFPSVAEPFLSFSILEILEKKSAKGGRRVKWSRSGRKLRVLQQLNSSNRDQREQKIEDEECGVRLQCYWKFVEVYVICFIIEVWIWKSFFRTEYCFHIRPCVILHRLAYTLMALRLVTSGRGRRRRGLRGVGVGTSH